MNMEDWGASDSLKDLTFEDMGWTTTQTKGANK